MVNYPTMYRVKRQFDGPVVNDLQTEVKTSINALLANHKFIPGAKIGIAVGSRGIASLAKIIKAIVLEVRNSDFKPFLIPAMGSHGGATPAGQRQVLQNLGINFSELNLECLAEMSTSVIGTTSDDVPVHFAQTAMEMDGLLICNRVKPHTRFTGNVQSGLLKMMTVGLGKENGAATYHRAERELEFDNLIREAAGIIIVNTPIIGGIALIENQSKQVAELISVPKYEMIDREPALLKRASELVPRLPLQKIDLLIVDEIGKEVSGTGMDTNVVGRKFNDHVSHPQDWCQTSLIYIRGLTCATAGNATGIGMAEFTNPEAVTQVDWVKTRINSITAGHPTAAMCPVVLDDDKAVIEAAMQIAGENLQILHIRNTAQLNEVYVSQSGLDELQQLEPSCVISSCDNYYGEYLHGF
ncbi:MAG TPA: [Fe-S]-binding protein [Planctomycetaceae bacterium]|nr:[Fe-S]-binding protein [Planctomycetaceae bacterium]